MGAIFELDRAHTQYPEGPESLAFRSRTSGLIGCWTDGRFRRAPTHINRVLRRQKSSGTHCGTIGAQFAEQARCL
ncbi:hypothetical protein FVE85_4994 [Porphyridium purpureum]|uniref:Uncharacterized protein n=1 Tax=Porphyridium purpureum TaxID=35688 RepID=A0A5J4YTW9_PORPP|nr:hypothetical protein FVE85_4994 [Porphyridium purpureum]|eukprot:POR3562..scf236_6